MTSPEALARRLSEAQLFLLRCIVSAKSFNGLIVGGSGRLRTARSLKALGLAVITAPYKYCATERGRLVDAAALNLKPR